MFKVRFRVRASLWQTLFGFKSNSSFWDSKTNWPKSQPSVSYKGCSYKRKSVSVPLCSLRSLGPYCGSKWAVAVSTPADCERPSDLTSPLVSRPVSTSGTACTSRGLLLPRADLYPHHGQRRMSACNNHRKTLPRWDLSCTNGVVTLFALRSNISLISPILRFI